MKPWKRLTLVASAALVLAGCAGPGGDGTAQDAGQSSQVSASSPAAPVIEPFEATVELKDFSAICREEACWLPTQFQPARAKGETVSLRDKWPMDGMKVLVLCEGGGESYQDQVGQETTAWYGILVPADKLEPKPGTDKQPQKAVGRDGWIGYVGAAWINGGHDKQAPYC
jgi:hypothetical protein